jgi:hypothetical protein
MNLTEALKQLNADPEAACIRRASWPADRYVRVAKPGEKLHRYVHVNRDDVESFDAADHRTAEDWETKWLEGEPVQGEVLTVDLVGMVCLPAAQLTQWAERVVTLSETEDAEDLADQAMKLAEEIETASRLSTPKKKR